MLNMTCLLLCLVTSVKDEIDNPEYKMWSKFKAGTSVSMTQSIDSAGQKMETVTVTTVKSSDAKEIVLTTKSSMTVAGQKMDQPAQDRTITAKIPKPEAQPVTEDKDTPKPKIEEGTEDLTVGGKKVSCKWMKVTSELGNNMKSVSKTWTSDDVPGSVAKMEMSMTGDNPTSMTTLVTAMEVK